MRRLCRAQLVVCNMSHRVDGEIVRKSVVHDIKESCARLGKKSAHVQLWDDKFYPWS